VTKALPTALLALTCAVLPSPVEGADPEALTAQGRRELRKKGAHYLRKGVPEVALRHFERALALPGGDRDERLILRTVWAYQLLNRWDDAFALLNQSRSLPNARRLASEIERSYGPVTFFPTEGGAEDGRIALATEGLIASGKKDVFSRARVDLAREVSLPIKQYLPFGRFRANGVEFKHVAGLVTVVKVPMPEVGVVTDGPVAKHWTLAEQVMAGVGGRFVFHDLATGDGAEIARRMIRRPPEVVVAVGPRAAAWCHNRIPGAALVFTRLPDEAWRKLVEADQDITGVADEPPWDLVVERLVEVAPKVARVGIVLHPKRTRREFAHAAGALRRAGLVPRVAHVRGPRQVGAALARLAATTDLLWVLPDSALWTRENLDLLVQVGLQRRKPTIVESEEEVERGALLAVRASDAEVGRAAGRIARRIVWDGVAPRQIPVDSPAEFAYVVNGATATRIGLSLGEETLEQAARVVGSYQPADEGRGE
jgi:putative ABC transport system substrate-binding protein